jgi:hypothetical protein
MQILNKENLDAAIKKCQDNKLYRVYLVTEHSKSHQDILDYISKFEPETICKYDEPYARFQNGSVIRMLSLSDSFLGRRAILVLCIEKYFNDKTADKLRPMEISYHMK